MSTRLLVRESRDIPRGEDCPLIVTYSYRLPYLPLFADREPVSIQEMVDSILNGGAQTVIVQEDFIQCELVFTIHGPAVLA